MLKNKKGFTLVEVIVVLVILAILAAILIPAYAKYIDKTNKKICDVNCGTIIRSYIAERSWYYTDKAKSADYYGMFEEAVKDQYGNVTCTGSGTDAVKFGGICKQGDYTASFDTDGNLTVICSVHGKTATSSVITTDDFIQYIQDSIDTSGIKSSVLATNPTGGNVDSEADGPRTTTINDKLKELYHLTEEQVDGFIWYYRIKKDSATGELTETLYVGKKDDSKAADNGKDIIIPTSKFVVDSAGNWTLVDDSFNVKLTQHPDGYDILEPYNSDNNGRWK